MTTIGSLFSGYSGLDAAVESVTGAETVWRSDIDPGACKIIAHHWPDTPNLGDITAVDWATVEPVDIITGGFPCTDVSMAGERRGLIRHGADKTRSGLWAEMANAIDILRPSLVVAENVRGVLSAGADSDVEPCPWCVGDHEGEPDLRALGAVLGDLADIGYDAAWHGLTAASVGAPHGRFRIFIVAWPSQDADRAARGERRVAAPGQAQGGRAWADTGGSGGAHLANADRSGSQGPQPAQGRYMPHGRAATHPTRDGRHEGWPEPAGIVGRHDAAQRGGAATADPVGVQPERRGDRRDMGGTQAEDEGTGRQRERVRDAVVDSGSVATDTDRDGLSQFGRELAGQRDSHRRNSPDRNGDEAKPASRMMGYWNHADSTEGRSDQDLRNVRGAVRAQAVQRSTRGSDPFPGSAELLAVVREHPDGSCEGHAPLASSEASAADLPEVWGDGRSARSSLGPEPEQQRPDEPTDPLLFLPPQDALVRGSAETYGRCGEGHGYGCSAWGIYAQAIHRWEICLSRVAPAPTEPTAKGRRRLSARAVEFMMGLPEGHVTDVPGLTRNEQLKALGNGVVPQQAEAALRVLLNARESAA